MNNSELLASTSKILLIYDEGNLKDLLYNCLTQNNYNTFYAKDLESAQTILYENTDITVVIANITVAGLDIVSILRKLTLISPEIISIICTDIIDFRKITSIINHAQVYKILTFPLDIDTELIPAVSELSVTTMARTAERNDLYAALHKNENLSDKYEQLQKLYKLQTKPRRDLYNHIVSSLNLCSEFLKDSLPQQTRDKVSSFQSFIIKQYFMSLIPRKESMEEIILQLEKIFDKPDLSKKLKIKLDGLNSSNPLLRSKLCYLMWLYLYRISLYDNKYFVSININLVTETSCRLDVIYRLDSGVWDAMNSDRLQRSFTATIDDLAELEAVSYKKNVDNDIITYKLTLNI